MGFICDPAQAHQLLVRADDGGAGGERHALPVPDHAEPDAGRGGRGRTAQQWDGLCRRVYRKQMNAARLPLHAGAVSQIALASSCSKG
jgi:hypothetical protein